MLAVNTLKLDLFANATFFPQNALTQCESESRSDLFCSMQEVLKSTLRMSVRSVRSDSCGSEDLHILRGGVGAGHGFLLRGGCGLISCMRI